MRFADDIIFISRDGQELQRMIDEFRVEGRKAGLQINANETVLLSNQEVPPNIVIEEIEIKVEEEAIYPGQLNSFKERMSREFRRRRAKGWRNFRSLKQIFESKMSMDLKTKIFDSCILPVLTYGAQTWAATRKQLNDLATSQIAMKRSMIGIKMRDRWRNTDIRKKSRVRNCRYMAKKLKWSYAEHITRRKEGRWEKKVLEWTPRERKRMVGRPSARWHDKINSNNGIAWGGDPRVHSRWKKVGEAYAQQWAH